MVNSAFDINMAALSNERLKEKLSQITFEDASKEFNCFVAKSGDYALAKKNFPYDDIENPAQSVVDICLTNIKQQPQKTDFIIIYGLGLGYILDEVYNRYNSRVVVYEPDLKLLRFVMENVDLSEILADKRVYISDDCEDCCQRISAQYLSHDKLDIIYLKNYALIRPKELIQLSNQIFNTCKAKISDINTIKTVSKFWVKNTIKNIENFNYIKPFYNLENSVSTGTALVLASGQSFMNNIDKIKSSRDMFTVFATGKTLKTLEEHSILPDFVLFSDAENKINLDELSSEYISQINLIMDIKSDSSVCTYNWRNVYFYFQSSSEFISKNAQKNDIKIYPAMGTSIFNALLCATKMGFKKVALCGFDLIEKNLENIENIRTASIKSVNGETVSASPDYAEFITLCENNIKLLDKDAKIYNITNSGAYIKGLNYLDFDKILPCENLNNINEILENCDFAKLNLRNDLESEIEALDELKELFSNGEINFTKINSLNKSSLAAEYTRFNILELVQGEFKREEIDKFTQNIISSIDEIKNIIMKGLVKV